MRAAISERSDDFSRFDEYAEEVSEHMALEKCDSGGSAVSARSDEVVFDLMPSAAATRESTKGNRRHHRSGGSVTSPGIEADFDLVPDAYDETDAKTAEKTTSSENSAEEEKEETSREVAKRYSYVQDKSSKSTKRHSSVQEKDKDAQKDSSHKDKSSKDGKERKRKRSFFQNFLKGDGGKGDHPTMRLSELEKEAKSSADKNTTAKSNYHIQHQMSQQAVASSKEDTSAAIHSSTHEAATSPSTTSITTSHDVTAGHSVDLDGVTEAEYFDASGGLRRGSKSDYELFARSMPHGTRMNDSKHQDESVTRSSQHLTQTCDASLFTALKQKSSQGNNNHHLHNEIQSLDSIDSSHQSDINTHRIQAAVDAAFESATSISEDEMSQCTSLPLQSPPDDSVDGNHKESLMRRLSRKVKSIGAKSNEMFAQPETLLDVAGMSALDKKGRGPDRFEMIDLSADDVGEKPPIRKLTYSMYLSQFGRCHVHYGFSEFARQFLVCISKPRLLISVTPHQCFLCTHIQKLPIKKSRP